MKQKFPISTKLKVVQEAKDTSITATSAKYDIDRKTIRKWIAQEGELALAEPSAFRLQGGGRRSSDAPLEEILLERILDARHEKLRVSRTMITNWAKELSDDTDNSLTFS